MLDGGDGPEDNHYAPSMMPAESQYQYFPTENSTSARLRQDAKAEPVNAHKECCINIALGNIDDLILFQMRIKVGTELNLEWLLNVQQSPSR